MFTVIFAISRSVGWVTHWMEFFTGDEQRIGRPQQRYTGAARRDFVRMKDRA